MYWHVLLYVMVCIGYVLTCIKIQYVLIWTKQPILWKVLPYILVCISISMYWITNLTCIKTQYVLIWTKRQILWKVLPYVLVCISICMYWIANWLQTFQLEAILHFNPRLMQHLFTIDTPVMSLNLIFNPQDGQRERPWPSIDVEQSLSTSSPKLSHTFLFIAGWYWPITAEFFKIPGNSLQRSPS